MILYPNLLKHNNVNIFWKTILERISIGDPPFGTKIINDYLFYKKSNIPLKNSNYEQIIEFFKEDVGLKLNYVYFQSWKDIKRKVIKDNLIQDFVNRFQKENNLSISQGNYLSSMIHLYITLKKFTHEDIILSITPYTHIKFIKGLYFNSETDEFIYEPNREYIEEIQDEDDEDDE